MRSVVARTDERPKAIQPAIRGELKLRFTSESLGYETRRHFPLCSRLVSRFSRYSHSPADEYCGLANLVRWRCLYARSPSLLDSLVRSELGKAPRRCLCRAPPRVRGHVESGRSNSQKAHEKA